MNKSLLSTLTRPVRCCSRNQASVRFTPRSGAFRQPSRRHRNGDPFPGRLSTTKALDATNGWRTSEARELARWRAIVADTLETRPMGTMFRCPLSAFCTSRCLGLSAGNGRDIGGTGNPWIFAWHGVEFRCSVCPRSLGVRKSFRRSAMSRSVRPPVGASRPQNFTRRRPQLAQSPPERILFIGDDLRNDYDGPCAAGFAALLINGHGHCERADVQRLGDLAELLRLCPPRRPPG